MAQPVSRRLAAILAADVAGYSRLMGKDDEGTLEALSAHLSELVEPCIAEHRGRVVKTTGDGLLAEFASVVDAVRCAAAFQDGMRARNAETPEARRIAFRIGVNLGDVIVKEGDVYGEGVNVAARLEGLAEPGGVIVSGSVHEQVKGKLGLGFDDLGSRAVKNIAEPVSVYRLVPAEPARAAGGATEAALPLPDKPSIAVLPFENMSADPEQEYFSEGITEDIITDLSKVSGLFVIARNSSFVYKGKHVSLRQVGRELGVRYVLEGSVRKAGERVRITAQLIDATSDSHLWADRYDGALEDIFALQDRVSSQVVSALEVRLSRREREAAAPKRDVAFESYDLLLQARQYFFRFTPEANAEGRRLLEEVLKREPDFPEAMAVFAEFHVQRWNQGWSQDSTETLAPAAELAERAIDLDASLSAGHIALAHVSLWQKRHDLAIREAGRGIELDPNGARAHGIRAMVMTLSGRPVEAIPAAEAAIRLDPNRSALYHWVLGQAQYHAAMYGEAEASFRRSAVLSSDFMPVHFYLAAASVRTGNPDQASAAMAEARRLNPAVSREYVRFLLPYRDPADLEGLIGDLLKAGLPA